MLHAFRKPLRIWNLDDGFTMTIGPSATGGPLAVGYIDGGDAMVIIHAMPARRKYLR
jgi:hypothetical protein